MKEHYVLNLGLGVQSTTLYLMAARGLLRVDYAINADTGDESVATCEHLDRLKTFQQSCATAPPIIVRTAGRISDDLRTGKNSTGQRFALIPAFTTNRDYADEAILEIQSLRTAMPQLSKMYVPLTLKQIMARFGSVSV